MSVQPTWDGLGLERLVGRAARWLGRDRLGPAAQRSRGCSPHPHREWPAGQI